MLNGDISGIDLVNETVLEDEIKELADLPAKRVYITLDQGSTGKKLDALNEDSEEDSKLEIPLPKHPNNRDLSAMSFEAFEQLL